MALLYLNQLLFQILPSPRLKAQGQLLSISNHLDMIHDCLWAIRAFISDSLLQVYYMHVLKMKKKQLRLEEMHEPDEISESQEQKLKKKKEEEENQVSFVKNPELTDWVKDVDLAIINTEEILNKILYWKPGRIAEALGLFRDSILKELKKLGHQLSYLERRGSALGLHKEMLDSMDPLQEEYSSILSREVVGRDQDKNYIIHLLKQRPIDNNIDHTTSIIIIDGEFPFEKELLGRMIYHDHWVREHFKYRIWVNAYYMEADPDCIGIAREIVRSVKGEEWLQKENANWSTVKDLLCNDKCLLILNGFDIFSDILDRWMDLKGNLLHLGAPGSAAMIITTTFTTDDQIFNEDEEKIHHIYKLGGISDDARKELLLAKQHVSILQPTIDHTERDLLNPTSSARAEGAIVRSTQMNRWNNTETLLFPDFSLKEDLSEFVQDHFLNDITNFHFILYTKIFSTNFAPYSKDILLMMDANSLLQHYKNVHTIVDKREIMPVDKHDMEELNIKRWIFELRKCEDERIPEQCLYLRLFLNSHASKLLFQRRLPTRIIKKLRTLVILPEEEKEDEIVLEDTVHEVILHLFKKLISLSILYIRAIKIIEIPKTLGRLQNLRYLKLSEIEIITLPRSLCNLYNLKVLDVDHCEKLQKLPEHIGKLVNLHFLYLTYCTRLQKLPKSISTLVNLEELDIEGCHWLTKLPEDLANLKKLRSIDMTECTSLIEMPVNIRQMTQLEVLLGVIVTYNDTNNLENKYVISELQNLINLRKLSLRNLERVSKQEKDIQMITLDNKVKLEKLSLHWEYYNMDDDTVDTTSLQILEALKPNPNHLNSLNIISYPGIDFSSWMKPGGVSSSYLLEYLKEIKLINIKRCERLPPLGYLPYLDIIYLSGIDLISVIDDSFYGDNGTFPSLTTIILCEMLVLEEWQVPERESEVLLLPRLRKLTLIQCPKFKGFNARITIYKLKIWLNNEILWTSSSSLLKNFGYFYQLKIVGCHELKYFPSGLKQLENISKLTIISCSKLKGVPDWLYSEHIKIQIEGCPRLRL